MKFFILWITTRIMKRGWPKTEGILRRRKVIAEGVIVAAMQDAVRVAITIGGTMPDTARAIAITCVEQRQSLTREDVDDWIDKASDRGDKKIGAMLGFYPMWLRLCAITASKGDELQYFVWSMDGPQYGWSDPVVTQSLSKATSLAAIAMAWAVKHPAEAQELFHDSNTLESTETELRDLVSASEIYPGWLRMAEELVTRYSAAVGFQRYEDLPRERLL